MSHLGVDPKCPYPSCPGKATGENPYINIQKYGHYVSQELKWQRYRCFKCKRTFSQTIVIGRGDLHGRRKPHIRIEAVALYNQGNSIRAVAEELGVNKNSVSSWIKEFGISRKVGRHSNEVESTVSEVASSGQDDLQISDNLPILDQEDEFSEIPTSITNDNAWEMIEKDDSDDEGWG